MSPQMEVKQSTKEKKEIYDAMKPNVYKNKKKYTRKKKHNKKEK